MWIGVCDGEKLDLGKGGDRYIIARGGEGGVGNSAFAASHRRSPKVSLLIHCFRGGSCFMQ